MAVPRPPPDLDGPISGADFSRLARGNPLPGERPHPLGGGRRIAGAAAPPPSQNEDFSGLEYLLPGISTKTGAWAPGGAIQQGLAQGKGVHQIPGATTLPPPDHPYVWASPGQQANPNPMSTSLWGNYGEWWKGPGGASDPWTAYPTSALPGLPSSIRPSHRPLPSGKDLDADWGSGMAYPYSGGMGGLGAYKPDLMGQFSFGQLSRAEQRKLVKKHEKHMKEQVKLAKTAEKLRDKEAKRNKKEQAKKVKMEKKAIKKLEKQMMSGKHPWGGYPLPNHHPIPLPYAAPVTSKPEANKPSLAVQPNPKNEYKFMYFPTSEFGLVKPPNSTGLPKEAGGKEKWPVMSRTMMHAMTNFGMEDKHHHMRVINQPTSTW
ncbi:hypothetical protein, variant [Cryptococcus amylolentus CBS 6039]|uniref:Uncharacterized protein n=1 Tax=Cryptococcus amylolentus CBS 6039 TaxID=1295533 RepID=A0A1E3HQI8_9TREE|nr:hypothetical protein, variant [Cryptococcus amylolentus CBS 6039]ODN78633.1 hypothetical protein, variant [Cryptococcus amylolentus CBS 6039]